MEPTEEKKTEEKKADDREEITEHSGLILADVSKQIVDEFNHAEKVVRALASAELFVLEPLHQPAKEPEEGRRHADFVQPSNNLGGPLS